MNRFRREYRVPGDRLTEFMVFGYVAGPGGGHVPIGLPLERLVGERGTHFLDQGPSRSGKTRLALAIARQAMRIPWLRNWGVDPKGDFSEGRKRLLASELERPGTEYLAERFRDIRLFDRAHPPQLRLTAREEQTPVSVQAASLSTALGEASGTELGSRMGYIFQYPAELAIETGRPLTAILDWLTRPATFAGAAAESGNERLRYFAVHELPRENKESLRALRARLERVLLLPSVRRALEAPTCFNFAEALEHYDVNIDASNPPAGEEAAVRMLCGPLFGRMTRAILNRRVKAGTTPVLVFIDELPEVLGKFEAEGVGRLVSLAGSRLVNFFLIIQDRVQLGSELARLLRTNCSIEALFRPSHRDAELVAHALPVPDAVERPAQARAALVQKLTRLPRRQYLFWCKDGRVPAHFVTAPRVDLETLPPAERLHEKLRAHAPVSDEATNQEPPPPPSALSSETPNLFPDVVEDAPDDDFPALG